MERGLVAKYFDVSAKSGAGVEELFSAAGEMLIEKIAAGGSENTDSAGVLHFFWSCDIKEIPIERECRRKRTICTKCFGTV